MSAPISLKARLVEAIDARSNHLRSIAETILHRPELGFKEHDTAAVVQREFRSAGIEFRAGLAITGVKAVLDTGRPGPTVAVLGELDSIGVAEHPLADPVTGAAHACGHNCQIASMLGAGLGLLESGALESLAGRVVLIAVPAEEYVEIEERMRLRAEGKLEFLVGKTELLRLGELDDVDMAMMVHTSSNPAEGHLAVGMTTNGMVAKFIRYLGQASHAGGAPHLGVNALGAAHVALAAIHAQRETFRDEDHIRVHPIITRGGELVSVIPADVRMETFVRGATPEAIEAAAHKVDRALRAGAMAMGARLELTTLPGYMPLINEPTMAGLFRANAVDIVGETNVGGGTHRSGGTDMGDLSQVMPVIHPVSAGGVGPTHSKDWFITDYNLAVNNPAKAMALTVVDLLSNNAEAAKRVLAESRPAMSRADYLAFARRLAREERYDGSAA